jgi:CubicO group peptidase (beta-lactamase class C family)
LRLLIGRGSIDGRRIIGEANLTETWRPLVDIHEAPGKPVEFPTVWSAYASDWIFRLTAGGCCIWHNGGTGLFRAHIGFVPDRHVGFVILTNEGTNDLVDAVGLWFYDRVLGNPVKDYSAESLAAAREGEKKALTLRQRPPTAKPSAPLDAYAGAYYSALLKDAAVSAQDDRLRLDFAAINRSWVLTPWNGDVFVLEPTDIAYADAFATGEPQFALFTRGPTGQATALQFEGSSECTLERKT